jgi:crotonobetaine/carnitine-CoA ligase
MARDDLSAIVQGWVLPRILVAQAQRFPERPYLAFDGGAPISFGAMEYRTRCLANGLAQQGVGFGDRVLLMLPNSVAFIETWLAVSRLGAVLVPVNTAWRGDLLSHVISDCGARMMIVGAAFTEAVNSATASCPVPLQMVVVGEGGAFEQLRQGPDHLVDAVVAVQDSAAILYTSGTTGRSKGALLPHGHLHLDPQVYIEQLGLTADDVIYTCLPLFHANALLLGAYGALILGCRLVLAPRFSASGWLDDIRRSGATVTNLLGVMTDFIFRQPVRDDDAQTALRVAVAVPISPTQGPQFESRFGVRLVELYGATEINCPVFQPLDAVRRPGSCGRLVDRWYEGRLV